jgi:two-component system cell cycle sensor histidine kinase/response regulator CckA
MTAAGGIVYLVDNDPEWLETLAERLEMGGIQVMRFTSGAQLIGYLKSIDIRAMHGVVLLDLMMPELNGEETFRRIRELGVAIPIGFLSSHVEDRRLDVLSVEGAAACITKTDRHIFEKIRLLVSG